MERNKKLDKAICTIVEGGAQLVDALDPAIRAVAAKGMHCLAMAIIRGAKCCEPEPCPPLCPPPCPPPPCKD